MAPDILGCEAAILGIEHFLNNHKKDSQIGQRKLNSIYYLGSIFPSRHIFEFKQKNSSFSFLFNHVCSDNNKYYLLFLICVRHARYYGEQNSSQETCILVGENSQ